LKYAISDKSENPADNIFTVHNPKIFVINIQTFSTYIPFGKEEYYSYDLREPKQKLVNPDSFKETKKTVISTNDWSNIPYYPTSREKRQNLVKYLMSTGRQVPEALLKQIAEDAKKDIEEDVFNKIHTNNNNTNNNNTNNNNTNNNNNHFRRQMPPPPPQRNFYPSYNRNAPRAQTKVRLGGAYR